MNITLTRPQFECLCHLAREAKRCSTVMGVPLVIKQNGIRIAVEESEVRIKLPDNGE